MALSQVQLNALNGVSDMTPNQSSAALSSSNHFMSGIVGDLSNLGNTYGDIGTGALKGALQTGRTVAGVDSNPVVKGMEQNAPAFQQDLNAEKSFLQPQDTAQQIGKTGEQIGEFFAPGGAEKDIVAAGSKLTDKLPDVFGLAGKAASTVKNLAKTGLKALTSAASMGTVTAGQGGDSEQVKSAAEFGGGAGIASGALEVFGPELSQMLNKADFRLSPAKEAKSTKIADSAAQFITDNKIHGTNPTKYNKLSMINNNLESVLQRSLPKGFSVPKDDIINNINQSIESLRASDPAVYNQARGQADEAIQLLQSQQGEDIPENKEMLALPPSTGRVENATVLKMPQSRIPEKMLPEVSFNKNFETTKPDPNISQRNPVMGSPSATPVNSKGIEVKDALFGKRSWGNKAFKLSAKGKIDPTVSNEGAYAVEQGYQKALEDTLSKTDSSIKIPSSMQSMFGGKGEVSLSDFNKVYSQAINAKNLTGIAQYKNDSGLFGRLFGLWVGKSLGQAISPGLMGEIVGGGIGEVASQHITGGARNILERGLATPGLPENAAKITQGIINSQ